MRRSKRIIVMAVIILAGFLLQYGVFANCPLIDTVPNILLIITVSFGFMKGKIQGMVIGLFCGFIMDIGSMDHLYPDRLYQWSAPSVDVFRLYRVSADRDHIQQPAVRDL